MRHRLLAAAASALPAFRLAPLRLAPVLLAPVFLALGAGPAGAAPDIIRKPEPSGFPISSSIEIPPGASTVYLSGVGADPSNPKAPKLTVAAYGDTETQVRSALTKIGSELKALGLGYADVIQMHVYLVADPATHKLDFAGMMKAYKEDFGTAGQPNVPTRSAFEVAGLANPGWLVEIEVTAVRR